MADRSRKAQRMIERLPATGAVLIVHSASMVGPFREAVERARGPEVAAVTRVIVAPSLIDERAATDGLSLPVFRDYLVDEQRQHRRALMQGFRL